MHISISAETMVRLPGLESDFYCDFYDVFPNFSTLHQFSTQEFNGYLVTPNGRFSTWLSGVSSPIKVRAGGYGAVHGRVMIMPPMLTSGP